MYPIPDIQDVVRLALREDVGSGDITAALIPENHRAQARLIGREAAVLCGQPWFDEVFRQLDPGLVVHWHFRDGDRFGADSLVAEIEGPARPLLTGERTALNFLQTLSGTATTAAALRQRLIPGLRLKDTRKTLPCLRQAQKYAVRTGGCENHRMGLYDAFLIKENHIAACGSIAAAVKQAKQLAPGKPVEVETENLQEVQQAVAAGADTIMLDNFSDADIVEAVRLIDRRAEIEVSGNLDIDRIDPAIFQGVDYISLGALTKHCRAIDYSMRVVTIEN